MTDPGAANFLSLRVLIVAEHASAKFGGEAILPLHYFRVLRSRGIEAWLIVHARTRDELSALFPRDLDRIRFISDTKFQKLLNVIGKRLPGHLRHFSVGFMARLSTQARARRLARRMIADHGIDVVHQPIPVSPKESSLLHGVGAPVIIGPMNGGMAYPAGFTSTQGWATTAFVRAGRLMANLLNRLMPGKLRAAALLVANDRTARALPRGSAARVVTLVENGVDLSVWKPVRPLADPQGRTRFAFTGRLVDWKAVDVLLDAFKIVSDQVPATLDILGSGPMLASLREQSQRLGLADRVTFHGWVAQALAAEKLASVDVFVLPSVYECGGAVVLEAMALGLPVIATDWGGPADYLDGDSGILVPPTSRGQFANDLSAAMLKLARDPGLRAKMGQAGRQRVEADFDWDRKVDRILEIYADAVADGHGRARVAIMPVS